MTGLEKMKSQILDEAGKAADVKVAEAKAQAEELIQAARTEAAREAESISRNQRQKLPITRSGPHHRWICRSVPGSWKQSRR